MQLLQVLALVAATGASSPVTWKPLQSGVELAVITVDHGSLYVVRVDPARATVTAGVASQANVAPQTAAQWSRGRRLAVAINLGMFNADQKSHTGYLRAGDHVNQAHWNSYRSILAVGPDDVSLPPMIWIDLDQSPRTAVLERYALVTQNLRLIAAPRRNVWPKSDKRWSEAALAADSRGRLLFLFSRAPYSMHDFNELLLKLPLDIVRAMHLEGGPEASLSVHVAGVDLDLCGSFETGFMPDDSNQRQWPLPNVLGVLRQDAK